jgi:hypothetical protein
VHTARGITRQAALATAILALAAPTAGAAAPQASPDISDYAQGRTPGKQPAVQVVRVTREVAAPRGFDWDSAGIGAGVAVGIVLVGGGGLLAVTRRRDVVTLRGRAT